MAITIDRTALRTALKEAILEDAEIQTRLQVDTFEGDHDDFFEKYLTSGNGAIVISYAGSREEYVANRRKGTQRRQKICRFILSLYAAAEGQAITYIQRLEELLDDEVITVDPNPPQDAWRVFVQQDQLTGKQSGYYAYEVRLLLEPV